MNWPRYVSAIATLEAIQGVDIAAEVPGTVNSIHFNSGQYIKKGETIVTLNADVEQATLKRYQATLQLARHNYEREKTLFQKQVSTKATLDARDSELQIAEANVETTQAQIKQKTITAPFEGRLGIRHINQGQFIQPGTPLVTLQALDPLFVNFSLPEQHLADLALGQAITVSIDLGGEKKVNGKITAIDSKVDPNTRNVLIQATIPNEQYRLYPGMYGLVQVYTNQKNQSIAIPQTAISYNHSGNYVYIIKDQSAAKDKSKLHAYQQTVKTGERRQDLVVIENGLTPGTEIVIAGQLKLQQGASIVLEQKKPMEG
jgi:membrane fusion protein (multidrug efflux system)